MNLWLLAQFSSTCKSKPTKWIYDEGHDMYITLLILFWLRCLRDNVLFT